MADLERDWSLTDVVEAHDVLDALDDAQERARIEAERKARAERTSRGRR